MIPGKIGTCTKIIVLMFLKVQHRIDGGDIGETIGPGGRPSMRYVLNGVSSW
jgi:hypothetical protein